MLLQRFMKCLPEIGFRRFRKDEEGAATVEAVLWLPAFILFFVMVAEVSFVFHRQSQVLRVVQDGNRALSVGRLASTNDVEDFIAARISNLSTRAQVSSGLADGVISTLVEIPVEDLVAVGMFDFLADYDVAIASQQFIEY